MLEASQKEIKNFTNLLRKKLKDGGCHQAYVNSLSDDQLLDDFRICCDCGDEIHSRDQQIRMILESNTAERAFELLYPEPEEDDHPDDENLSWLFEEEDHDALIAIKQNEDEDDEEDELLIRGKWIFDGADTIDDMLDCLEDFKQYLLDLKNDKFELTNTVEDDYGFLRRKHKQE